MVDCFILSGNVQSNSGPELQCVQTPSNFKSLSGLKIVYLIMCSLLLKMDIVKIWLKSTDADIFVISETWLTKSVTDKDINIDKYIELRMV